ncbi:lactonase family protein [Clostridium uliginosum]|uniref:6-phosphogluconolactonase n=1 Tax=Clostridium uliginosum TaxID=119641 RepID=A0A1I1NZ56_9CLOT|nr:lactonase family protein [Clostridium uliginosum]SFD02686.1 6-phosphogluconolactonase [Clostridium uliginosum]
MILHQDVIIGFIGTYTKNTSKGIYKFSFNLSSGKIEKINLAYEIENPTYLAIDKERNILYSTCTVGDKSGVSSFKFFGEKDNIDLINYNLSETKPPCHITIRKNRQLLISSNYHENKMIVYNTLDGIILNSYKIAKHTGSSTDPLRQQEPHIHCSIFTHDEKYILSIDLGIDKLMVYTLDNNELTQRADLSYSFPKGSGPRHVTYSKSKPFYYVLSELTGEIFTFIYNPNEQVPFKNTQIISALPDTYKGEKSGAAIHVHKNNKFLYTSDRKNNSISLFYINETDGKLKYVDTFSCKGNSPRDFQMDPYGKFIICGNQDSDNISIFSINPSTGALKFIGLEDVPTPTCIKFIE